MIQVNFPSNVNTKFFGYKAKPKENVVLSEKLSGRTVGHRANTKDLMTITCSLLLNKTELSAFWEWFNNSLGQTSGAFFCSALGKENQLYRFTSVPDPQDTDTVYTTLNLELQEIL